MGKLTVVVHYPDGKEESVAITKARYIVGSAADCDVVVADAAVEQHHLLILSTPGGFEVENVAREKSAWLNDEHLYERAPFLAGDILRVGEVRITVRNKEDEGCAKSADTSGILRESVRRDAAIGWRGYRRVVDKLSSFISVDEAREASACYKRGWRMLFFVAAVLLAGNLCAIVSEYHGLNCISQIAWVTLQVLTNVAILCLIWRFHIPFAGRALRTLSALVQLLFVPVLFGSEFIVSIETIGFAYLFGWMNDYGAGFVFQEVSWKKARQLAAMVLSWFYFSMQCGSWTRGCGNTLAVWALLAETPVLIFAWFYGRTFALNSHVAQDSLFVAEIASRRALRRMLVQGVALVFLLAPVLSVMSLLGEDERRQWPAGDADVAWSDENSRNEAWFWEDCGKYLKKSDLDSKQFFVLPFSSLEVSVPSNKQVTASSFNVDHDGRSEASDGDCSGTLDTLPTAIAAIKEGADYWFSPDKRVSGVRQVRGRVTSLSKGVVPSDFATNVCALIDVLSADATNSVAYECLCESLAPLRMMSADFPMFAQDLWTNSVCVMCERKPGRHSVPSFTAKIVIGVPDYIRRMLCRENIDSETQYDEFGVPQGVRLDEANLFENVDSLVPYTRDEIMRTGIVTDRLKYGIVLILVLSAFAALVLWRRGSDSMVGFWLGLGLFAYVGIIAGLIANTDGVVPVYMHDAIVQHSLTNPLYLLLLACLPVVSFAGSVCGVLRILAQSVLFVALCLPSVERFGKWDRFWVVVGRVLVVFLPLALIEVHCTVAHPSLAIAMRLAAVLLMGSVGLSLRRKRRQNTEVHHLGFPFFLGWLAVEVANAVLYVWASPSCAGSIQQLLQLHIPCAGLELGKLLCVVLPVLTLVSWFWLFLRQRFLNLLSMGGIVVTLFVYCLPLFRYFAEKLTLYISSPDDAIFPQEGMKLIYAIVVGVVSPTLMKVLRRMVRRTFMRPVYVMERNVAAAIEKMFDESSDIGETISKVLSCMKISKFVFYERTSKDGFARIAMANWVENVPRTLALSEQARASLGRTHELMDFEQLPFRPELFFVSFELWRMYISTKGALMLPICLGTSVRGLLFVGSEDSSGIPADSPLMTCVNSLGLSSVTPR